MPRTPAKRPTLKPSAKAGLTTVATLAAKQAAGLVAGQRCSGGLCQPQRTQGLARTEVIGQSSDDVGVRRGTQELISLSGAGLFLTGRVVIAGGRVGLVTVSLDLDGRNVVAGTLAGLRTAGLTAANPTGVVALAGGGASTIAIGFPLALRFERSLRLVVRVDEDGVTSIVAEVVHGR